MTPGQQVTATVIRPVAVRLAGTVIATSNGGALVLVQTPDGPHWCQRANVEALPKQIGVEEGTMSDIDTLTGRALDRAVGERLMGLRVEPVGVFYRLLHRTGGYFRTEYYNESGAWSDCSHYSTDIAAAWSVVEELRRRGHVMELLSYTYNDPAAWGVQFGREHRPWADGSAEESTAAEAICKAALRAVAAQADGSAGAGEEGAG